ncbi:MAG: DUF5681 domain-containing protein [Alphaproteobacteria bacterium]|nr:DUF5681 domain-containing protein [Alphaproteobacteria bacterium]
MDDIPTDEEPNEKPRGRPFEPGQSGNPKGRPKGSRNKTTLLAEALLDGDADAIMRKLVEMAKDGDPTALRLCLDRMLPARRDRPIAFDFDEIKCPADAVKASSAALAACADGSITPDEAIKVMGLITSHLAMLEGAELETELRALEQEVQKG